MKKKIQAFTLLEAMVIVAIIGLLTAYGIPMLNSITTNTGLTTTNNDLVSALQYARSSSIRLQGRVVVCTSNNSDTATPTCGDVTVPWTDGWLIFHDRNNSADYEGADVLLRTRPQIETNNLTITPVPLAGTPTNIVNFVSFNSPAGEPMLQDMTNQSGIFRICAANDTERIRGVIVNVSGRVSSTRDTSVIGSSCP